MSGDNSASASDKDDNALFNARGNKKKIKLGKILKDRGLLASYGLNNNIQYVISLLSASKIMVAQSGESVEGYSLRDVNLTYETIESNDLYSQALAEYADTDFPFEHITHSVEISIDGDPNAVYSKGMKTNDLYREAKRVFKVRDTDMTEERFYDNKFTLVIDLRNNSDNSAMGSGCKVFLHKRGHNKRCKV